MSAESTVSTVSTLSSSPAGTHRWAYALLMRLHFYIGLMVGPFVLIAAFTGALYIISPQIENQLYQDQLYTDSVGEPVPLAAQIQAAIDKVGGSATPAAVRPAPEPGQTTRVMFVDPGLAQYQHRAIFVDPVTTSVVGDLGVYGTSGALPLRTWIDHLHRSLHLGDVGRHYSELAASWLWIVALGGVALWYSRRRASARKSGSPPGATTRRVPGSVLGRRHSTLGLVLLIGLLFFSVTGLTWSKWAGGNISVMRANLDWGTPRVNTALHPEPAPTGEHQHHHGTDDNPAGSPVAPSEEHFALFDKVLASARAAGIDAGMVEIKPAASADRAWTVAEIDRRWPTQVDAAAVDPGTLQVVDRTDFQTFPLAAKLTRWGIDAHMGVLFGLPNQLVLLFFALGICLMVIWGYRMWWARRPTRQSPGAAAPRLVEALCRTPRAALVVVMAIAALLGWALPVMGVSLLVFLAIDLLLFRARGKPA